MEAILITVEEEIIKSLKGTVSGENYEGNIIQVLSTFLGCCPKTQAIGYLGIKIKIAIRDGEGDSYGVGEFSYDVNGKSYEIRIRTEWVMGKCSYYEVLIANDTVSQFQSLCNSESSKDTAKELFQFCADGMVCTRCSDRITLSTEPYFGTCDLCLSEWNDTPCKVCGSHFGVIRERKHINGC